ncbi:MAG: 16S rRNA (uracil(1498)-N(3))-methyltransferase [Candidatus Eremiobacteraeota bacterium]|nr:16S rRNA (uracil(1498)-N(3))-methyltransferase [Candidatus Eremiobacteraeota bacterium]
MGATRFFVSGVHAPGSIVPLARDDARKLIVVLRSKAGDALEVVDSSGRRYAASLRLDGSTASAALERELAAPASTALRITLAQGIPKGQKMDFVVEKATELGVARLVPFVSERTVGGEGARDGKLERWRRLAKTAAQQSGRGDVPSVDDPIGFGELVATFAAYDAAFVPWELEGGVALRERLPFLLEGARDVLIAIGPEGGLASGEAELAREGGAHLISLGSRIFRTETAGLVACAALLYASGDL